jgi:hypothetical protein
LSCGLTLLGSGAIPMNSGDMVDLNADTVIE